MARAKVPAVWQLPLHRGCGASLVCAQSLVACGPLCCAPRRANRCTRWSEHTRRGKRGQQGTCSRVVINGLLCVALLCRMFSQCFTLLAAAAAPISSKQAVRCTPVAAMTVPQTAPSCHPQRMTAVRNGRCAPLMLLLRLCGILLLNRRRSRPWMTPVSTILSTPSVLARAPTR